MTRTLKTKVTTFITATNTNGVTGLELVHDAIVHAFDNRGETSQLSRLCFELNPSDGSRMKKILSAVVEGAKVNKNKETGQMLITFKNASRKPDMMMALKALIEQGEGFRNEYVKETLFPSTKADFDKVKFFKALFKKMTDNSVTIAELDREYAAFKAEHAVAIAA